MNIKVEKYSTIIKIENNNSLMTDKFDDGSHMSIFFTGGYASVSLSQEETEALIKALQLAIS